MAQRLNTDRRNTESLISWQITPITLTKAIADPDGAVAKHAFDAMMEMTKIDIATIEATHRG